MQHIPEPILFHPLKHHLQYIRCFIKATGTGNVAGVKTTLKTIGASQLDLYTGELSPQQIARETIFYLGQHNLSSPEAYSAYLMDRDVDYRVIGLSDNTDWVLRWGVQANRYVHLHPARHTCNTRRIKATTLKTAIAALVYSHHTGSDINLHLINQVRTEWLELSPIKDFPVQKGLRRIIDLLKDDQ